jgi:hypothetical protein
MQGRAAKFVCLVGVALVGMSIFAPPVYSQTQQGETLNGADSYETELEPDGHHLGDWGGERSRLLERGVNFDFSTSAILSGTSRACKRSISRVGSAYEEP